jgi:hypothetical protein
VLCGSFLKHRGTESTEERKEEGRRRKEEGGRRKEEGGEGRGGVVVGRLRSGGCGTGG